MSVRVESTTDPEAFLGAARDFLGGNPVEHSVILTNAAHRRRAGVWTSVVRDEAVVAASMVTPPHALQVSLGGSDDLAALVGHHHAAGREIPGVGGMRGPAELFAMHWSGMRGVRMREVHATRVYVCDAVSPPSGVPGHLRPAALSDVDLLVPWGRRFNAETGGLSDDDPVTPRLSDGRLHVWEAGGRVVSMSALTSREHGYSRVQLVYTPPELRGQGYASACVAALVQKELTAGGTCMLHADAANRATNAIYQAIGFRPVGDAVKLAFA
jgi:predicted GNAT family acetyltransferase